MDRPRPDVVFWRAVGVGLLMLSLPVISIALIVVALAFHE